jgi:hypothetical protein
MAVVAALFLILGIPALLISTFWLLATAFDEGWGLTCMFVPFGLIFFVVTHWNKASKPFLLHILAFTLTGIGIFIQQDLGMVR